MTACSIDVACDLPNVQCAYPNCVFGRRPKSPRTDALVAPEMDMDDMGKHWISIPLGTLLVRNERLEAT